MSKDHVTELTIGNWYKVVEEISSTGVFDLAVRDKRSGDVYLLEIDNLEDYDKFIALLSEGSIAKVKKVVGQ
jgi:hypothetical protein